MRIVQLLPDLNAGGVERGVVELSRALVLRGHDSVVISRPGALTAAIVEDGARHVAFDCGGKNPLTVPRRARRLRALLDDIRPDIAHVRSRVPAWLLRFAGGDGFAVVSTFHGIYRVNRYSGRMADAVRVICPSRAVMRHVAEHYAPPAGRLRLVHRGVDLDYFSPAKADADFCADFRRRHKLEDGKIVAIAGRFSSLKGHDIFLRAFAALRRELPQKIPIYAMLVGDGSERRLAALQRMAAELGIGEHTRFVGGQQQMREMYHIADVVVSASRRPEAFGRTVAEALAMERPVVAPAHGGALDIVADGENGFLFPPSDADALAAALARALQTDWRGLRDSVKQFSLARMVEQTLAVYEEAAEEGKNTAAEHQRAV